MSLTAVLGKRVLVLMLIYQFCLASCVLASADDSELLHYIDPYIGTGGHGHTFVAASVPFGMIQVGPTGFLKGWDWCSGYHYSDKVIRGFCHMHLSGTGCSDLCDVLLMPNTGDVKVRAGSDGNPDSGFASRFSHDRETVSPYYYSVMLDDYNTKVELAATERVAIHKYHFPADEPGHVVVDLHAGSTDRPVETFINQIDERTFVGYRFSSGWARDQRVFFAIRLQKEATGFNVYSNNVQIEGTAAADTKVKGVIKFAKSSEPVMLKVGISPVSMDKAIANIDAEIPGWDFDKVVAESKQNWSNELDKIKVESNDDSVKRAFYTAVYHTMVAPTLFNDHDKQYLGTDKKVYTDAEFDNYTIFSLWDTYRSEHPLLTITQPDRVNDMVHSMLAIYQQQGMLPVWHLWGNETWTMVGYHAVPVIVDAYFKGLTDADPELLFKALKDTAMNDRDGVNYLKSMGYIPADKTKESVAMSLEYAIDDDCIAMMAKALGKQDDYEYFKKRAMNYKRHFDPETTFMRGIKTDGAWNTPFDPAVSQHRNDDYCEGNAWQYTWLVPHDPHGLIGLFGSDEAFVRKLDMLFSVSSEQKAGASADITGLIGQYAHGNEPSHHISYLYSFAGQQWKTAEKVRQIMDTMYDDTHEGLCGNEDCGQMSAWYVLSAMGFYPVHPAASVYVLGSPAVDKVEIKAASDKKFAIIAENNSSDNIYIQSVTYNGQPYSKGYITHDMILDGGELVLQMGSRPNKEFASKLTNRP